jgi:addiction module RelE/StbE family toxin
LKRIFWTNQFKKDYKRAQKQGKNIKALKDVLVLLADGQKLPPRYKDHSLHGRLESFPGLSYQAGLGSYLQN